MSIKDISYLELWWPFCSAERNHLCNLSRGYQEGQFCEIILNLDPLIRRCHLKDFLSGALAALLLSGAEPFVQFLKEGIMGNIHVNLNGIRIIGLGDVV